MKKVFYIVVILLVIAVAVLIYAEYLHRKHELARFRTVTPGIMRTLASAIEANKLMSGSDIPNDQDAFTSMLSALEKEWNVDLSVTDLWGMELKYARLTNGFEIRSSGQDRTFFTEDDIVVKREHNPAPSSPDK